MVLRPEIVGFVYIYGYKRYFMRIYVPVLTTKSTKYLTKNAKLLHDKPDSVIFDLSVFGIIEVVSSE